MLGSTSPLMLIAGEGLLQNTGLGINSTLTSNITTYTNINVVREFALALSASSGKANFQTFAANTVPAFCNTIPSTAASIDDYAPDTTPTADGGSSDLEESIPTNVPGGARLTNIIESHSNNILGNGDLSKFVVQMYSVMVLTEGSGQLIGSAELSQEFLGPTFTDMDNLITGNISGVSRATAAFGNDLINTGRLLDLSKVEKYGTPESLILRLYELGLLKYISTELNEAGVSVDGLILKISSLGTYDSLPLIVQKKCYDAFKAVTGNKLSILLETLLIDNSKITTLADVLNTSKIFPTSFRTLTSPIKSEYKAIYSDANASVNSRFAGIGKEFYSVIPHDIADANAAMRRSLQQIKGIKNLTARDLGTLSRQIETNQGLDLINSLDKPVPDSVKSYFTGTFGTGNGTNGRYYLSDGIGTPSGIVHNDAFAVVIENLNSLTSNGALNDLANAFVVLRRFLEDYYGVPHLGTSEEDPTTYAIIPGHEPGAGTYTDYPTGANAILSAASGYISTITTNYPTEVAAINTNYNVIANQIKTELSTLAEAGVVFAETPSNKQSLISLVQNLHTYARQNEYRGPGEILEKMADISTQAGQAIIGALREGRNMNTLQTSGIGLDNIINTSSQTSAAADITTGQYTVESALSNINID